MSATLTDRLPSLPPARADRDAAVARMLVAFRSGATLVHRSLHDLPEVLTEGDVLVVNTSKVVPAALAGRRADGTAVRVHLSTWTPEGSWLIELREPDGAGSRPFGHARQGEEITLPGGGRAGLLRAHQSSPIPGGVRLWEAWMDLPGGVDAYLAAHGAPVRYAVAGNPPGVPDQTVFATVPGSAEPPSAALGFTGGLVARLVAVGVEIAPIVLHCGVSSPEASEAPHGEWYAVSRATARRVNAARGAGGRVIAVGTTATRALETVADVDGFVRPGRGWTEHVVTPATGVRAIDGLLTGWHEPDASHLELITAVAGRRLVDHSYRAAAQAGYLGHEHGDVHLILP